MRCVCVINNYNYARYLADCLNAVRLQTRPFDLVLLIDDGSTDDSLSVARSLAENWPQLQIVSKSNGGQLSCFNAAIPFIQPDDLVCMLDADDVFAHDYLDHLVQAVSGQAADFYFCEPCMFETPQSPLDSAKVTTVLGDNFTWEASSYASRCWQVWIGSPTSCIALRGKLYLKLLPYPHEADWITRADDVLVWGASLAGVAKHHLLNLRVGYRIHGSNAFARKTFSEAYKIRHSLHVDRLFNHFCERFELTRRPPGLGDWARREAHLVPDYLWRRYRLPEKRKLYLDRYKGLKKQIKKLQWMLGGGRR